MNKFKLTIGPLIDVHLRHDIEKVIEKHGYSVIGGGSDLTNKSMGISCEYPDVPIMVKAAIIPKRTTDG